MKNVRLKDSDPLALRMKPGAVVSMTDGWCGTVQSDDGEFVVMVRDGEQMNSAFRGYRGLRRQAVRVGRDKVMTRSPVVDLAARKMLKPSIAIVDRARIESSWSALDGDWTA
ncbi:hypothetical protein AAFG07_20870 [Bradyrhizobium sp. B097]|uniref:hypothetical protein n=1 Tax=Bradyrhizobium sp. B097 TaxID=3140244 RepID=UPI0031841E9A